MKHLYTVTPVNCIVVTRVKAVVRLHVGSGKAVELSSGGLCVLQFYFNNICRPQGGNEPT